MLKTALKCCFSNLTFPVLTQEGYISTALAFTFSEEQVVAVSSTEAGVGLFKPEAKTDVVLGKLQTSSKLSHEGANGGIAKAQAFQLPLTGAPNCWQTPPRRPSGL